MRIALISVHGLIRGDNLELGRDADTGDQTKYVVELARALAECEGIRQVDLITRLVADAAVDADYRGEIQVGLINLGAEPFTVEHGMRVAQMLIQPVHRTRWVEWEALPASERGAGGFGHTGR